MTSNVSTTNAKANSSHVVHSSRHQNIHPLTMCGKESFGKTADFVDRAVELADRTESRITRLGLGDLHVGALQALRQNVHDLGRDISNVLVSHIDLVEHLVEPLKALLGIGLKAGGDGGRYGESHKRRYLLEVAWVESHEELVEDVGLAIGGDPL